MSVGIKYILLSTFYFAIMNVFVKKLSHLPSSEVSLFRAILPLIISYIMLKRAKIHVWGNNKKLLIARGFFGTIGLLLYFYTLQEIPLATAVTLQYLSPIFSTILSGLILKEYTKPIQLLFFLISFIGIIIMKGFDTRISTELVVIGIISAFSSAIAYNVIRKLKDYDNPLVTVFYFPLTTVPLVAPYVFFHWVTPRPIDWLYVIVIGIATQQAQLYMTKAYQAEKMAKVANLNYVGTIYALIFGYFIFGESVSFSSLIGILFVISGSVLSSLYKEDKVKS